MRLSGVYKNVTRWAVAYPTGHAIDEIEVELVDDHYFDSYEKAVKHMDSLDRSRFTDLLVVQVSGFGYLTVK